MHPLNIITRSFSIHNMQAEWISYYYLLFTSELKSPVATPSTK